MRTLMLFALGAALMTARVYAMDPHLAGHLPGPGFVLLQVMAERLNLTADQEESIEQLISNTRLASAVDRERLSQLRGRRHGTGGSRAGTS